ncbi:hypothetical protein [Streptomyces umbrinus]|uniref:hypothetical protein n=1 Tax=Streptomyces umbrinus TaxID=67370 RepID=UPI0033E41756
MRADEALRLWASPVIERWQLESPAVVACEEHDDLPPFDYNDEGDDADPLFVAVHRALWAPLDESEHRDASPAGMRESAARSGQDDLEACSEAQDEAEDNEKTLELAISFSVPRTKSQNFQEAMREARVVQGLISLPASEDCARPTHLMLTANHKLSSKSRPVQALSDGRRRLLDAIVTGCLGGLFVAANTLHSQFVVMAGLVFAAHCVRLAVPTPLMGGRRIWRVLKQLGRRGRRAM